jgi:alanine dehydrogenase
MNAVQTVETEFTKIRDEAAKFLHLIPEDQQESFTSAITSAGTNIKDAAVADAQTTSPTLAPIVQVVKQQGVIIADDALDALDAGLRDLLDGYVAKKFTGDTASTIENVADSLLDHLTAGGKNYLLGLARTPGTPPVTT